MVEDKVIREVFDFLKIELNGIVCAPFLNYLERKYLTKTKGKRRMPMTDNDIIKALECCVNTEYISDCAKCKMLAVDCKDKLIESALDLINRQKAEIERLKLEIDGVKEANCILRNNNEIAINKAITEFAERLKKEAEYVSIDREGDFVFFYKGNDFEMYDTVSEWLAKAIDQIAKEMKGLPTEDNDVKCKDCEYLMFSDCYGECRKAYKGIVNPNDSCGKGKKRVKGEQ